MQYELEYEVYRHLGYGVYEKERGSVYFEDVQSAQEFTESPMGMLGWFGAERGSFALWMVGADFPIWELKLSADGANRLPLAYREFRDAIFNQVA